MMPFYKVIRQKMKDYMTTIKAGEIWVAAIPFPNSMSSKKRPVLILWLDGAFGLELHLLRNV